MNKSILLILILVAALQGRAQAVADSIYTLYPRLGTAASSAACKGLDDYKNSLRELETGSFYQTASALLAADSQFLQRTKASCPVRSKVVIIDSLLYALRQQPPADSVSIIKAITFIKNKLGGLLRFSITVKPDAVAKARPAWQLEGTDAATMPPRYNEEGTTELYVKPGKAYMLRLSANGYEPVLQAVRAFKNDTGIIITLKAVTVTDPDTPMPQPELPENQKKPSVWMPVMLGLLIAAVAFLSFLLFKKSVPNQSSITSSANQFTPDKLPVSDSGTVQQLEKKIKEQNSLITKYQADVKNLQMRQPLGKQDQPVPGNYFLSEIMVTAGPRKKPMNEAYADKDLGEDVCGFITAGDQTLAWLLDGTSDFYCLHNPDTHQEYFSSRLLAQSIARKLKGHLGPQQPAELDSIMQMIIGEVRADWLETISALPLSEKERLIRNIQSGNFPECAATVLLSRLSLNGDLSVYRSGDSKMLIYTISGDGRMLVNNTLSGKNAKSNDRIFFRLVVTDDSSIDLLHNDPLFEIEKVQQVQAIVGMSDGIGKATEAAFREAYTIDPDAVRHQIVQQIQGTEDDKSIYIIEIKTTNGKSN